MSCNCYSDPKINLFHAAVVGPALAYAGYQSYNGNFELSQNASIALIIVAIIVILYHLWKYYTKTSASKPEVPEIIFAPAPEPAQEPAQAVEHLF